MIDPISTSRLAQFGDDLDDPVGGIAQLIGRCKAPNTNPQARLCKVPIQAERCEDIRRTFGGRSTGSTGRHSQVPQLGNQQFTIDARKGQVEIAVIAMLQAAVDFQLGGDWLQRHLWR